MMLQKNGDSGRGGRKSDGNELLMMRDWDEESSGGSVA